MRSANPKPKILAVEDEREILDLLVFNLKQAGFDVVHAGDGVSALKKARNESPDLILLDVLLPEMDGLEVCKALRRDRLTSEIPLIMLTAKAAEVDRILGLELGADDYITKPFSPRELVLRIRKLLQRRQTRTETDDHFEIGNLILDISRHQVFVNKTPIELTATEFKLLQILVRRRGRVQSRDQLLRDVWDYENILDTRTVDTHIRRLREKLGDAASSIETVRNVGYRFLDTA